MRTKSVEQSIRETDEPEYQLKRRLSALDLTVFGIGVIIGAGIFTVTGRAALEYAGPSIIISFVIGAFCCGLAALCYAEFASTVPVSGSAYTYSYATLGELVAWIIGWDLILEYAVGNIGVAVSWSGYLVSLFDGLGIDIPRWLATDVRTGLATPEILASAPRIGGVPILINLPAAFVCFAVTVLLVIGIKESARFNTAMVLL